MAKLPPDSLGHNIPSKSLKALREAEVTPHKKNMGFLEFTSGLCYRAWQTVKPTPATLIRVIRSRPEQHPIYSPLWLSEPGGQEHTGQEGPLPDPLEFRPTRQPAVNGSSGKGQ